MSNSPNTTTSADEASWMNRITGARMIASILQIDDKEEDEFVIIASKQRQPPKPQTYRSYKRTPEHRFRVIPKERRRWMSANDLTDEQREQRRRDREEHELWKQRQHLWDMYDDGDLSLTFVPLDPFYFT